MANRFDCFTAVGAFQNGFFEVPTPLLFFQYIAVAVITRTQVGPDAHHPDAHIFDAENWAFFTLVADHVSHEIPVFLSPIGQRSFERAIFRTAGSHQPFETMIVSPDCLYLQFGHVTDVASSISSSVHSSPRDRLIDQRTDSLKMVEHSGQ